jgi:hypothetical protein
MDCDLYKDPGRYQAHLNLALEQLRIIRSLPYLHPAPGSPASFAFDPYIARRLNTFGPLRTHELPTQERVWEMLEGFLNDCDELRLMCSTTSIATWEVRWSHDLVVFSFTEIVVPLDCRVLASLVNATPPEASIHTFMYPSE